MGDKGLKMKGGGPTNSVYRSGQRSFNSRPAWTKLEAKQGILERLAGHAKVLVDMANTNPQSSQTFQLNPTKNI